MKGQALIRAGMQVAVIGYGLSGQAAMRYALACGAAVRISDSAERQLFAERHGAGLAELGVRWEADAHRLEFFDGVDVVVVSPGISLQQPVVQALRQKGVPCLGELAVAAPLIDIPVVAITGTNGKTTVTTLIGELLRRSGEKVFVGGNIGTPLLEYVRGGVAADVLVLELSSFQLQLAGDFGAQVGVLLNITPDHLDLHRDMDEYIQAKMRIFANQPKNGAAILCLDDPCCAAQAAGLGHRLLAYGHGPECQARISGSSIALRWRGQDERYDLHGCHLDFPIGIANSAAALLAVRALGMSAEDILSGLRAFSPLPHRLQLVAERDGVRYVDDSKGTNTGAVIAALADLSGKAVLIAGGRHKGEDYRLLSDSVRAKVRVLIVIGEAAGLIAKALAGCAPIHQAGTMEAAVLLASQLAQPGDTVLLSPACSSFDMFRSYSHRGDVFAAAVKALSSAESPSREAADV